MPSLRHRADARSGERGFSLVELMVAMLVLTVVMLATAGIFVSAIRGIDEAKRRQTGAALGTEVMEQLRSLPYDAIRAGMLDDGTLTTGHGVLPVAEERVSTTGVSVPPPLSPHVRVQRINNTEYTTRTYVSIVPLQPGYWLTAVVTWQTRSGKPQRVVYRSQAFSPAGCLSTGQHPFSGPCQASLYASAGTSAGSIAIRPVTAGGTIVEGLNVQELEIGLPGLSASSIVEQTTAVTGKSTGTRVSLKRTGAAPAVILGGQSAVSNSDDDPSTAGGAVSSETLPVASPIAPPLTETSTTFGTLSATLAGSDTGFSRSALRADAAPSCLTTALTPTPVEGDQPCGSGFVTTSAGASTLRMALPALNGGAGFELASVAGASTTRARAARHVVTGTPTYCAAPVGDGCAVAVIDRNHGAFKLGGLPAAVGSTGKTSLVEVTGLREFVTSVVGEGATPTAPQVEGTMTYWTGSAFASINLATLNSGTAPVIPKSTYTATYGSVSLTVTIDLILKPPTVEVTGPAAGVLGVPDCSTESCTRNVTTDSVVAGTLTYNLSNSSGALADFTIDVALGGTVAKTTYKAAGV